MESLGIDGSFSSTGSPKIDTRLALGNTSAGTVVSRMNIEDSLRDASVIAAGTALIGGTISGGAGLALIALGPVGWLIGAALFGSVGLGGGFFASWLRNRGKISDADRSDFVAKLLEKENEAKKMGQGMAELWVTEVRASFSKTRIQILTEKEAELSHIQAILNDKTSIERSLSTVHELRLKMKELI